MIGESANGSWSRFYRQRGTVPTGRGQTCFAPSLRGRTTPWRNRTRGDGPTCKNSSETSTQRTLFPERFVYAARRSDSLMVIEGRWVMSEEEVKRHQGDALLALREARQELNLLLATAGQMSKKFYRVAELLRDLKTSTSFPRGPAVDLLQLPVMD